jgi:peptidoglycan/xylan/chitin deacetylase (PgdA/CDA1 family)
MNLFGSLIGIFGTCCFLSLIDAEETGSGFHVYKKCRSERMIALTFDDGVV